MSYQIDHIPFEIYFGDYAKSSVNELFEGYNDCVRIGIYKCDPEFIVQFKNHQIDVITDNLFASDHQQYDDVNDFFLIKNRLIQ